MRRWRQGANVGLLAMAGFVIYEATAVLPVFYFGQPGSGLLPLLLALLLAALTVVLMFSNGGAAEPKRGGERAFIDAAGALRMAGALALLALSAFSFEWIGAPASAGLLVGLWLGLLERKPVLRSVLVGCLTAAGIYLVFVAGLKAELPVGIWTR